jgi:Tol biopolymer transport system component
MSRPTKKKLTFLTLIFSNQYGVIKQRLTYNDVFDGEAAVSPDGKIVVFSRFDGEDYNLFRMNVDDSGLKRVGGSFLICF